MGTRAEAGRPVKRMGRSSRCNGWWLGMGCGEKQTDSGHRANEQDLRRANRCGIGRCSLIPRYLSEATRWLLVSSLST